MFLFELAQKATVNGRFYVRVPALSSKAEYLGFFYFTNTKEGALQSLYVQTNQKDKTKLDGMVGFVDFDKQTYSVASYQNNKLIALYGMKDTRSLFKDAFSGADKQLNPKMNGGCEETTSIAKSENGNDSTIVNAIKVHGGIECPGYRTFWQQLGDFFSGIWGNITDAFDWLFGSGCGGGGGSAGGWGNGGGYAGSGAFGGGGYIDWGFSGFVGSGFVGSGSGGVGAYTGGGQQWGPYNPNFLDEADAYAQSLGY